MIRKFCSLSIIATALLLIRCGSGNELSRTEYYGVFGDGELSVSPEFNIFHISPDTSLLYVKIDSENLLYSKASSEEFTAGVIAEISLLPPTKTEGDNLLYKKAIKMVDEDSEQRPKSLLATTKVAIPEGEVYRLQIQLRDINNQKTATRNLKVDKRDKLNGQNFLVYKNNSQIPLFTDRIVPGQKYTVKSSSAPDGQLYLYYYDREFSLPPPPFAYYDPPPFDYKPDKFSVIPTQDGTISFTPRESGFYQIKNDTNTTKGLALFVAYEGFPEVTRIQNMLDPFRYLVSGKEYKQILESANEKRAIEDFWISWSGDKSRARKSIKAYYERVEEANRYFSSHVEGWKSDKGLIYIIYGKPNKVYKTEDVETWIYGEENNPLSVTFNFVRVINPFTDNDYRLSREDVYKPSWYRSIEAWRNGRIY